MTKQDITNTIKYIKSIAEYSESAHNAEDRLHEEFIEYIAHREDHLGEKARLILTTKSIIFERWNA